MENLILTVDQAFRGKNFEILHEALTDLNLKGVFDPNFFPLLQHSIETREGWENLKEAAGVIVQ